MSKRRSFTLKLTDEQKAAMKEATGQEAEAVELEVEELEDRIAPARWGRLPGLHRSI